MMLRDRTFFVLESAIAQALERHRKLGESIAVWRDGRVVTLTADRIPPTPSTDNQKQESQ